MRSWFDMVRRGPLFGLAVVSAFVFCAIVPGGPVGAETIFDPENPAFEEDGDDSEQQQEDGDGSGSLIIDDPERPDFSGLDEDEKKEEQTGDDVDGGDFRDTEWTLDYELGTLVDPYIGPEGTDALEVIGGLGMELRHQLSEQTRAVVSGRFSYWGGSGRSFDEWRTHYEPRLERAYLVHRSGRWSMALGQMRNRWGSTDIVAPGDVIDPVDLRSPLGAEGIGTGIGQLSATVAFGEDDWTVRALLVPFFQNNRVSVFGRDTSLMHERNPVVGEQLPFLLAAEQLVDASMQEEVQPFLQASQRPLALPHNVSAGLRADWTVANTDLGLGVFYGWDRTPWIELDDDLRQLLVLMGEDGQIYEDFDVPAFISRHPEAANHFENVTERAAAGESMFDSKYYRRATLLAEMARYFGPIGVRADVAFSPRQVFYTDQLSSVRRPSLFGAVGLSYERLLDGIRPLGVTVEGFWLHPFGADAAPTRWMVPAEQRGDGAEPLLLFENGYYGVATAANWATGLWDLELTGGMVASISPGDFIGQFALERSWSDGVTTRVGTNLFFGPDPSRQLTPGGLWAHANRVYLTVGGRF